MRCALFFLASGVLAKAIVQQKAYDMFDDVSEYSGERRVPLLVTFTPADLSSAHSSQEMLLLAMRQGTVSSGTSVADFESSGQYFEVRGNWVWQRLLERHRATRRLLRVLVPRATVLENIPISNAFMVLLSRNELDLLAAADDQVVEVHANQSFRVPAPIVQANYAISAGGSVAEEQENEHDTGSAMLPRDEEALVDFEDGAEDARAPLKPIGKHGDRVVERDEDEAQLTEKAASAMEAADALMLAEVGLADAEWLGGVAADYEERRTDGHWNQALIGAPTVWTSATRGEGMLYAIADTGVQWTHANLRGNYAGLRPDGSVDHNYTWYDGVRRPVEECAGCGPGRASEGTSVLGRFAEWFHADEKKQASLGRTRARDTMSGTGPCGIASEEPCDDSGHGTHVASTAVGSDGYGTAPGARWMACRNMDRGVGSAETYLLCLNFFLAPHDLRRRNADPSLRPHVVGNSYGCPDSEGCTKTAMRAATDALRAAGVFMSVSAGNSGPRCSTIMDPPAVDPAVVSVAATDSNDRLASFSSRGPVNVVGGVEPYRKPDVSAPGVHVVAAYMGSTFRSLSGTSMASPHVGGAALLISAACPRLRRNVDAIEALLESTAHPLQPPATGIAGGRAGGNLCGLDGPSSVPNNYFGHGRIDVAAAVRKCMAM